MLRRRGAGGLALRRGSRSALTDPEAVLRRLCRLVPRLITSTAAAEGTTGRNAGGGSESGGQDSGAASRVEEAVPPFDRTEKTFKMTDGGINVWGGGPETVRTMGWTVFQPGVTHSDGLPGSKTR